MSITEMNKVTTNNFRRFLPKEWRLAIFSASRLTIIDYLLETGTGIRTGNTKFISYAVERSVSKFPQQFVMGALEGHWAIAAVHSTTVFGIITFLSLEIPASAIAAFLVEAFMMYGTYYLLGSNG